MEACGKKDGETRIGPTSCSGEDALSLIRTDVEKVLESELQKLKEEKKQRDATFFETKAQKDLIQGKYYHLCAKINDLIKEIQKHDLDFYRAEVDVASISDTNINVIFENLKCVFQEKYLNADQKTDNISSTSLLLLKNEQENEKQKLKQQIQTLCQEQETIKNELESSKSHAFGLLQKLSCARSELITSEENHRKRIIAITSNHDSEKHIFETSISQLRLERDRLASDLHGSDSELESCRELLVDFKNEISTLKESFKMLKAENERLKSEVERLDREKHQFESKIDGSQPQKMDLSKEESIGRLEKECNRLRKHLIMMEERYTQEALESEAQKEDLARELELLRSELASSIASAKNVRSDSSKQLESVTMRLNEATAEKANLQKKLEESENLVARYSASIENLHAVLEQFEKDQQFLQLAELEKCKQELKLESAKCLRLTKQNASLELVYTVKQLQSELNGLKNQSAEVKEMEEKLRMATSSERDEIIRKLREELNKMREDSSSKVDKIIMKNLLMGYMHAPTSKKVEAFSIIGKFLDFSKDEFAVVNMSGSWSDYLRQQCPSSGQVQPQSFAELFVKFLERESRPVGAIPKMSTEFGNHHHHNLHLYGRSNSRQEESMQRFLHSLKQHKDLPLQDVSNSSVEDSPSSPPEIGERPNDAPVDGESQPDSANSI